MIAIDNSHLSTMCHTCDCQGFEPIVSFEYDAEAKKVTAKDESVFSTGDSLKNINVEVFDDFGTCVPGSITAGGGTVDILVPSIDPTNGVFIKATIASNGGCVADGRASRIGAAGLIGSWNISSINSEVSTATP